MVSTLARLLAVTSSIVWWTLRPLIAAYMPRIIGASLPFAASSKRSGRVVLRPCASGDHGTVDVGEHVLAHVLGTHRRDDGVVRDGHDVGRVVDEDHGVARALAGGAGDPLG